MNHILVYDAKTKKRILEALLDSLYLPAELDLRKRLHQIVIKNSILCGNAQKAFNYRGKFYQVDPTKPLARPVNKLDPKLKPQMQQLLKDQQEIEEKELPYVKAFIIKILNTTNHFPDYYELLPPSMHDVLDELKIQCPCRTGHLSAKRIQSIREKNVVPVELMKQRMMYNLLLNQ